MPVDYLNLPRSPDEPEEPDPKALDDVDRLMESVAGKKRRVPHIAEVIEYLIDEWGGARRFARAYYDEYKKASSVHFKGRMLESIIRLMQVHGAQEPQEEMSALSNDELRAVAMSLLGPFYAQQKAQIQQAPASGDGSAENPPDSGRGRRRKGEIGLIAPPAGTDAAPAAG